MIIRSVIIDDEARLRTSLKDLIGMFCTGISVVGEADDVQSGIDLIRSVEPDIVFLDIRLKKGTGFDIIEQLAQSKEDEFDTNFKIIFTTAYEQYALKAFKFSASDYLLKPIDPNELIATIEKVKKTIRIQSEETSFGVLIEHLKNKDSQPERIVLNTAEGVHVCRLDEIVRCESESNYTRFFLIKDKPILVSKTLKEYEKLLEECGFERVHKSHLINLNFLKHYSKTKDQVLMTDGSTVPVAYRKRDQLLKRIHSL